MKVGLDYNGSKKIDKIMLNHEGTKLRFGAVINPYYSGVLEDTAKESFVEFTFNDSWEIDSLISMLTEFKRATTGVCGNWKRDSNTIGVSFNRDVGQSGTI